MSPQTRLCTPHGSLSSEPATPPISPLTSSGGPASGSLPIAKQLQDVLGDHQDAVFAEARIRAWAVSYDPAGAFAAGRLVQLERDRKASARAAWPELWQRLDDAARRAVR